MTRQDRAALVFTAPVLLLIALFLLLPTLVALGLSATDFDIYALGDLARLRFVGTSNYFNLLRDPLFWRAWGNTALFAALGVPLTIGASLAAALLLHSRSVRWKPVWRVALFAPYVTTLVATAVVWRYLLDQRFGLINYTLGRVGIAPVDWLGNPRTSIPAILFFIAWKIFGYNMIVFTAALAAVPTDLMEAARIDGANFRTRFRHVTLPAIGPVVLLAGVLSVANFLQIFDEPYVMTQGGPAQSTVTVVYFMFNEGFEYWNLGSASVVAVMLFAVAYCVTRAQVRLGRHYEWV